MHICVGWGSISIAQQIKKRERETFLHCTREDLCTARVMQEQHHQAGVQKQQPHKQAENNTLASSANTHIKTIKLGRALEEIRL